ncbi:MAG: Wzt carbohydrate-binding domain-containing protein [Kouleothrix sp.]
MRIRACFFQRITRPVFGMGIHHENGVWVYGPNTHFDNVEIPLVDGAGYVDFNIPALPLLAGRYLISAAIAIRRAACLRRSRSALPPGGAGTTMCAIFMVCSPFPTAGAGAVLPSL